MDKRSSANWLKRIMSKIMRQKEGLRALEGCAKSEVAEVPDHSKAPASREMPKVISEAMVLTRRALRNWMKFAVVDRKHYIDNTVLKVETNGM
jgi:hypothetical protein